MVVRTGVVHTVEESTLGPSLWNNQMPCSIKYHSSQGYVCTLCLTQDLPFPTLLSLSLTLLLSSLFCNSCWLLPWFTLNMVLYYRWEMMIWDLVYLVDSLVNNVEAKHFCAAKVIEDLVIINLLLRERQSCPDEPLSTEMSARFHRCVAKFSYDWSFPLRWIL